MTFVLPTVASGSTTLDYLNKREFFVYEPFQLPLTAGSAFYIGHAPMAGASPFRGWLEEVIFDPCSGSGNGGGGKPSEEH